MKKPVSLVADFSLLPRTIALALEGRQLQPVFLPLKPGDKPGREKGRFPRDAVILQPPRRLVPPLGGRRACLENFFLYKLPVLGYDKGYHSRALPAVEYF